jgi:ABC-type hemin transport system substrate-binding protein
MNPNNSLPSSTTGQTEHQGVFNQFSRTAISAHRPGHLFKQVSAAIEASTATEASAKRTYILFVLDTSGSMVVGKELTRDGQEAPPFRSGRNGRLLFRGFML